MDDFKREPKDFDMLFEYLRYKQVKNIIQKVNMDFMKASSSE
jgi:hypothetical protein